MNELCTRFPDSYNGLSTADKTAYLVGKLNRPIKVCGMVKNEGEPGGGPFWIVDDKNRISLQIVESAQMDMSSENQKEIIDYEAYKARIKEEKPKKDDHEYNNFKAKYLAERGKG